MSTTTSVVIEEVRTRVADRMRTLSYPGSYDNVETNMMMIRVLATLSLWPVNDRKVCGTLADNPECDLMSHLLGEALDCQLDLGPLGEVEQSGRQGSIRW